VGLRNNNLLVSHLLFANDTLIFGKQIVNEQCYAEAKFPDVIRKLCFSQVLPIVNSPVNNIVYYYVLKWFWD
jgi:hypothetical protein